MNRRPLLEVLRWNRFTLVALFIPLARAVCYPLGVVPPQFEEAQVAPLVRVVSIALLGLGSVIAYIGVLGQWPIVERTGLHLVAPLCVAYAVVLFAADPATSVVSVASYLVIAGACIDRAVEITRSTRLVNRWLEDRP